MSALTSVCRRIEKTVKHLLYADKLNLPCDSKSAKTCYCCHLLRSYFTGQGKPVPKVAGVVVVFHKLKRENGMLTKAWLMADKRFSDYVVTTCGTKLAVKRRVKP